MIGTLILAIALAATLYGSYTDIKIREVPNWISYPLIGAMLLIQLIDFAFTRNLTNLLYALGTGAAFFALGMGMFYARQWGGADLKVLAALGIGFGTLPSQFRPDYLTGWPFGVTLLMNVFIVAGVYSILYGFVISLGKKGVADVFKKSITQNEKLLMGGSFIAGCAGALIWPIAVVLAFAAPMWLLLKYMKIVEKSCLVRDRLWDEVVEFDVPVKDVVYKGKLLQSSKDPNGFSVKTLEDCRKLARRGLIDKRIIVKWGIPMIPVYPIAILTSVFVGDLMYWLFTLVI